MFASFRRGSPGTPPTAPSRIASWPAIASRSASVSVSPVSRKRAAPSEKSRLLESDAGARGRGIQHLLRLGDDLRTDAVTGDDGELHDARHLRLLQRDMRSFCPCQRTGGTGRPRSAASVLDRHPLRAAAEGERGDHGRDDDEARADQRRDADARVEGVGRGIPKRLAERLVERVRRGDGAGEGLARGVRDVGGQPRRQREVRRDRTRRGCRR